jgi:apolipoprotein N-acyltransferase
VTPGVTPALVTRPLVNLPRAVALSALSGVVMWLAFPPVAFGPYAVVAVALLTTALWRASLRRGLGLGLLAGVVFFALLLGWMRVVGWDAWILLTLLCASWIALVGFGTALVSRLPGAPVWIGSVWVLSEALRGRVPFGGFPWGELSFAQPGSPLVALAPLGGSALVSFAVAFIGAAIVTISMDFRAGLRAWPTVWLAGAALLVFVPAVVGLPSAGDSTGGEPSAAVAIVQGGTPEFGLGSMDSRRAVLNNHVAQTMDLAKAIDAGTAPRPAFILWPENSSDIDPFVDAEAAAAISAAAKAVGAPILVGAVISVPDNPNGVWNVGIVWDPVKGPTQMYIKNHPVPFGEYIPFRDFLAEHIARFDRIPRDFIAGRDPGNLTIGGIPVGNVICFEIAYRDVVDAVVAGGARMLTVQTNNSTYGGTAQPEQQLAIERLRATEFGRSVVVAATSGISAAIAPDGSFLERMDEGAVGWRVVDVPLRGQDTWANAIGHALELAFCAVALLAMATGLLWPVRRRRQPIA